MNRPMLTLALALAGASLAPAALAQASPAEAQVNALEGLFGKQAGSRRSQAKGVCASGYFVGNTVGRSLSSSAVFSGQPVPVTVRFSVGGGNPKASDKSKSARGFAVEFAAPGGERWQQANISAPIFFVSKPEQFAGFFQARTPDPATGKPDPAKLKAFNDANPETTLQPAYFARTPVPASYVGTNYWGVNAFEVVDAKGASRFVRWQFVPEAGTQGLSDDQLKAMPDDFLADELRKRVATAPVAFDFKFQLAEAGDQTIDPTKAWPDSRTVLPVGRLVIDKVEPAAGGACDRVTYNPLVLPTGIKASADPVLLARPAPYVVSLGRRLAEAAAK